MTIMAFRIRHGDRRGDLPKVNVTLEDGTNLDLFSFDPRYAEYVREQFVGLTIKQAMRLR